MSIKNSGGLFIGLLLGGAIGGAIALLYAPKSGKHFRNDLSRKTNEFIDDSKRKANEKWTEVKEKTENTIDRANEFLNTGFEKITERSGKIRNAFRARLNMHNDGSYPSRQSTIFTESVDYINNQIT